MKYACVEFEEFCLKNDGANKWFLTKSNQIVEMKYVFETSGTIQIKGKPVKDQKSFFETPVKSSFLNIYVSSLEKSSEMLCTIKDIKCKMVAVPIPKCKEVVFIPLLHTL